MSVANVWTTDPRSADQRHAYLYLTCIKETVVRGANLSHAHI